MRDKKMQDAQIQLEPVSRLRRARYAVIDAGVFCVIWWFTVVFARVEPPAFAFMSAYTPQQYRDYIYAVSVMSAILFVNSVIMHWLFGGSIGKIIKGCRTYRLDNQSPVKNAFQAL
jgi:hypothetical protein